MIHQLADENSKRFIVVLNKKIPLGKLLNALGHMSAGLAGESGKAREMSFLEYVDKDGGVHPHISHFPFIVLKAENSNQIREVRKGALEKNLLFTDFTSSMTVGTSQQQQDKTRATPEEDLEYYGICLFGDTEELKTLTKKFSLFS
jgi:hypothetical protein